MKAHLADSEAAASLVAQLKAAGRDARRLGRRVSVVASNQHDAQQLAGEIDAAHPAARVQVRGD